MEDNMSPYIKKFSLFILALIVAIPLAACGSVPTASASCAFVAGNGKNGADTNIHTIIYPGQTVPSEDNTKVMYVPCNSRNFIINDGSVKNANGQIVGDQAQLITATTKSGVPVLIAASAFWTLNENKDAMEQFYTFC